MERRAVRLSLGRVPYLALTSSWHPTFEVLFLAGGTASTKRMSSIAGHLAAYGNAYIVDLNDLSQDGDQAEDEASAVLEWTKETRVRKPVLVACPASLATVAAFAADLPQFTLGVVGLHEGAGDDERATGSIQGFLRDLLHGIGQVIRPSERRPTQADLDRFSRLTLPRLNLSFDDDPAMLADSIKRFAGAIEPTSPASERHPRPRQPSPSTRRT